MAMCYRVKSLDLSRWESTCQECQSWDLVWMTKYSLKLPAVSKNTRFWSVPASLLHLKKTTNKQTNKRKGTLDLFKCCGLMTYCMYWKYRKTFLHTDWLMSKAFFDSGQIFLIFISSETMERWYDYCACTMVFLRSHEPFIYCPCTSTKVLPFFPLLQTRGYVLSLAKLKTRIHDVPYLCFQWFGKS